MWKVASVMATGGPHPLSPIDLFLHYIFCMCVGFQQSLLSCHPVGPGDGIQIASLGGK